MRQQRRHASLSQAPGFARTPAALVEAARFAFGALAADVDLVIDAGTPVESFDVDLAGFVVRFRVAGDALAAAIRMPYRHRLLPADNVRQPDLVADLWDGAAVGVACSAIPLDPRMGPFGKAIWSRDGNYVTYQRPGSTSWLDLGGNRIIAWTESVDRLYLDERGKPLHKLIALWLRERAVTVAHAGAVGRQGRGVMLTGRGGSGKSTTALACLAAGMQYAGDDFIGMATDGAKMPLAHSLFASALLETEHLRRLPLYVGHAIPPNHEHEVKSLVALGEGFAEQLVPSLEVAAIVLPRVSGASAHRLRPASRIEALLALAPSTVLMMPRPEHRVFDRLVDLVERLPAYWLDLGSDLGTIPEALAPIMPAA